MASTKFNSLTNSQKIQNIFEDTNLKPGRWQALNSTSHDICFVPNDDSSFSIKVTDFKEEENIVYGKTAKGWMKLYSTSTKTCNTIYAYPYKFLLSLRSDSLLRGLKMSLLSHVAFLELYLMVNSKRSAITSTLRKLPNDAVDIISSFLFEIYDASNQLSIGDRAVITGRRDKLFEGESCILIEYHQTWEKFTVKRVSSPEILVDVFVSNLKPDVSPTHVFYPIVRKRRNSLNYFVMKQGVEAIMDSRFHETAPHLRLKDWSKINIPSTLRTLNLFGSNFAGDLSHTRLHTLDLSEVKTDDWSKIRLPSTLKDLNLSGSNFNGTLADTNIERLNLTRVKMNDWDGIFPSTLIELNLQKTNFDGDFSSLANDDVSTRPPKLCMGETCLIIVYRKEGKPLKVTL